MKYLLYLLVFLGLIVCAGVGFSHFAAKGVVAYTPEPVVRASQPSSSASSTMLVGRIEAQFRFDGVDYTDSEGVRVTFKSGSRTYEVISDSEGLWRMALDEGRYELTTLIYRRTSDAYKIDFELRLGLYFELTPGAVNNLGTLIWSYSGAHEAKQQNDQSLVRAMFETKGFSAPVWVDTTLSSFEPVSDMRDAPDPAWDNEALDTAAAAPYLSAVERDVILETNKVRTNPAKYADEYIKPMLGMFDGTLLKEPGKLPQKTVEGARAVQECYDALLRAPAVGKLRPSHALTRAATDHVNDQSRSGATGHGGSDGSTPFDRIQRYASAYKIAGENIAYKPVTAREIVVGLLVDDGVSDRGHRTNMLLGDYDTTGVAMGNHDGFGTMTVIEYAGGLVEK